MKVRKTVTLSEEVLEALEYQQVGIAQSTGNLYNFSQLVEAFLKAELKRRGHEF